MIVPSVIATTARKITVLVEDVNALNAVVVKMIKVGVKANLCFIFEYGNTKNMGAV